jgi:hypothetical protein
MYPARGGAIFQACFAPARQKIFSFFRSFENIQSKRFKYLKK